MDTTRILKITQSIIMLSFALVLMSCAKQQPAPTGDFEQQVNDYIKKFPYQDTYSYVMKYTNGDPARFNVWVLGEVPALVKAGEDKVVRMNNDTFYKLAFVVLDKGPVVLESSSPAEDRFNSFQLMDDRNANYRNVVYPKGQYTLYHGERPAQIQGEAIEVPSSLSVVIVRVEVKDKNNAGDAAAAEKVFNGITITGPKLDTIPKVDLLSGFDKKVEQEAHKRIDQAIATIPFTQTIVGPGQEPGKDVPYLNHAAGTKGGWGGPHPSHSAYQLIFNDADGNTLDGSKGAYTLATEEPQVKAFWSVTVYDTKRGGFFHPNKDNRYHINNSSAVKNADGTVTFTFRQQCAEQDKNCLEVPANAFDITARFYLPSDKIIRGEWKLPNPTLTTN